MSPEQMAAAVTEARGGDLAAFARLVEATQSMAYAVAFRVLHRDANAGDAVQDAYLTACKRLGELNDVQAFAGWLRRIVIATALNHRRSARGVWLELADQHSPPILDDEEQPARCTAVRLRARAIWRRFINSSCSRSTIGTR